MSLEPTTLGDWATRDRPEFDGARYGRADPTTEPPEPDTVDPACCQNCGNPVSHRFRRVFGDRSDVLWHCSECVAMVDMIRGAGADGGFEPRVATGGDGR